MTTRSRANRTAATVAGQFENGTYQWRNPVPENVLHRARESARGTPGMNLMQWMAEFGVLDYERKSMRLCMNVQEEAGSVRRSIEARESILLRDMVEKISVQYNETMNFESRTLSANMMPLIESVVKVWARFIWGRLVAPEFVAFKVFVENLPVVILKKLTYELNFPDELVDSYLDSVDRLESSDSIFGTNPGPHLLRTDLVQVGARTDSFVEHSIEVRIAIESESDSTFWTLKGLPKFILDRYSKKTTENIRFYVRKCYDEMLPLLCAVCDPNRTDEEIRVILVTGVPGIGKSLFSLYFMFLHLMKGQDVYVEYDVGEYRQMTVVEMLEDLPSLKRMRISYREFCIPPSEPTTQSVVISDLKELREPGCRGRFTYIFSSPDERRYKQSMKEAADSSLELIMPTWSRKEFVLALAPPTWELNYEKIGGVPRWVYKSNDAVDRIVEKTIERKGGDFAEHMFSLGLIMHQDRINYLFLHVNPEKDSMGNWIYTGRHERTWATDYIIKKLWFLKLSDLRQKAESCFFSESGKTRLGAHAAGLLFEILILSKGVFASQRTLTPFNSHLPKLEIVIPCMRDLADDWKDKARISLEFGCRYKPKSKNFASVDAFGVIEHHGEFLLLCIQVTVAEQHPVKMSGLLTLIDAYPFEIQ